jgi:two-component system sensor histidine kinase KdpD
MVVLRRKANRRLQQWPVAFVWAIAFLVMRWMDGAVDLANLALVLVLASAASGLWLGALESAIVCGLAVMAFNWQFVPPRGTFTVDLRQHVWLLLAMLGVGSLVAWITARQRVIAAAARSLAAHAQVQRDFSEQLRGATSAIAIGQLGRGLRELCAAQVCIGLCPAGASPAQIELLHGAADEEEWAHLRECHRSAEPATLKLADVHGHLALVLPLRGQLQCLGAALLHLPAGQVLDPATRSTAQALCDQAALHCERDAIDARNRRLQEEANAQKVRNTLLAAISHDYRTPLASILGAASSLVRQSERLTGAQARALAQTVVDEVELLSTMTDNTLELARLDAAGVRIHRDWESLEELVGSAVARARQRYAGVRLNLRIAAALPLLRCDASLLVQLLNNLVDNAVKYGGTGQIIEIIARPLESEVLLAVADRGPGIAPGARERVFLAFERGASGAEIPAGVRGAGLGLALCRAIVHAHGGTLQARQRQRGGTSMECRFPLEAQPERPSGEEEAAA